MFPDEDYNEIEFPCPRTGSYVTTSRCFECSQASRCDIYSTMLDENHDR